ISSMIIWFLFGSEGFKTYGLLKSNGVAFDHGPFFVTAMRNEPGITIYGSDLIILLAYAPLMPPLRSLPLSMTCDDSDGASREVQLWRLEVSFTRVFLFSLFLTHRVSQNVSIRHGYFCDIQSAQIAMDICNNMAVSRVAATCARYEDTHVAHIPNFGGTQNDSCDVFEKYTNMCDRLLADNDNLTSPFIPSKDTTTICPSSSAQHGRARGKTQPTPPPVEAVDRLSIGMVHTSSTWPMTAITSEVIYTKSEVEREVERIKKRELVDSQIVRKYKMTDTLSTLGERLVPSCFVIFDL
ncbi:hypothetical protein Tco_0918903, partial [Tanacetum coccineum]